MKGEKGQSLVEVLAALAVIVTVVVALVRVTVSAIRNADFAKNQTLATKYAQEGIEEARKMRDESSQTFFVDGSCNRLEEIIDIFTRSRTCKLEGEVMTVKVAVSWTGVGDKIHESALTTYLTKWK